MTAGITTPFRVATSSVRRCADLRQAVAGLRSAATCAAAWKSAGVRFPSAVLGEALLGMMSTQFRKLLQSSNTEAETQDRRETRRGFIASAERTTDDVAWGHPQDENRSQASFVSAGNPAAHRGFEGAAVASATRSTGPAGQILSTPYMETAWETAGENGATLIPWPGGSPPSGNSIQPEPSGALAEKLREYWALERRDHKARLPTAAESGRPSEQGAEFQPAPRSIVESPRFKGRADFASRLQAFISGSAKPPDGDVRQGIQEARQAPPNHYLSQDLTAPGSRLPLAGDFAERLSQTLREQALHHGIDLT
jgi:hypothetical protein